MLHVGGLPDTRDNLAPTRNSHCPARIGSSVTACCMPFNFDNGRVSYRNRWVRTPKWLAEHAAGRALYGSYNRRLPDAPASTPADGGVANTNVVFHAGKLLALEEGHHVAWCDRRLRQGDAVRALQGALCRHRA